MTISIGQKLPDFTFKQATADGPKDVTTAEFFGGRRVVLFAVPGAFTPTCNNNHLPGFIENYDAFIAHGIDAVAVVGANDVFVMSAWSKASGAGDRIVFLADGNAAFAHALGLDIDLAKAGLGTRYKRFSMLVEDGVVKQLNVEDVPSNAEISGAAHLLAQLG